MPGVSVAVTTKTTVVFGTSAFVNDIMAIGLPSVSRESIDTSHFNTGLASGNDFGSKTFIHSCLTDAGEFTMDVHFNPFALPPIEGNTETVTITFPLVSGDTTSTIFTFQAFLQAFEFTGPLEDKMTASLTWKITGSVVVTLAT